MSADAKEPPSEYQLIGPAEDGQINDLLSGKTAKEGRQRLQALIAEWLRMENLVVLAGAGTSVSSGGKTMDTLERTTLETLKLLPKAPSSIEPVIDARLAPVAPDAMPSRLGFEDWLSYLVNGHFIGLMPNSPFVGVQWKSTEALTQAELSWFVEWIRAAIFAECALTLPDATTAAVGPADVAPHLASMPNAWG